MDDLFHSDGVMGVGIRFCSGDGRQSDPYTVGGRNRCAPGTAGQRPKAESVNLAQTISKTFGRPSRSPFLFSENKTWQVENLFDCKKGDLPTIN